MNALDKAYKELTQSKKQKQEIRLESNPVVIMHEFKNEVMRFLKQLASIALTHDYRTSITNFPKVQQVEVSKLPKEAFKVVNEIDTTKIEKMISEMKEMSKRDKQVLVKNQVDMSMVETLLESVVRAVEASKKTNDGSTTKDSKELLKAITELKDVMSKDKQMAVTIANFDSFPVALPIASYKNSAGETKQGLVDADNHVQVDVLTSPAVTLNTDTVPVSGATEAVSVAILDGSGNQITSFGGGTQYTEGDTDASITGTAVMWEDTSDTLRPVSASKPLPVNIVSGSASGTEYTEGDVDATLTGTIAMAEGPSNTATPLQVDASKHLQVDIAATSADITVQDGGGSLTVDNNGTFATQAAQSGTWNITNVSGTVSLPTGASTLAEQQSQTTHLSTIAGDTTSIQTAVELIDDTVQVLGTDTYTEATSKGVTIGAVRRDADTTLVNTTNEFGPLQMDANGRLKVEAFSGETLPVSLTSTTVTGTVAVTQSGTWDEVGINDSGNSITVDYATTGSGTATGALRVELPTNGTGVIATVGAVTSITNALPAGTNAIGKLAANSGVDIGDVDILSIAAGTNNIGNVGVIPRTSGGATPYKLVSAATTNATSVKGSAGQVFMITASNVNAAVRYLKLYNKASAPTVGSDTPVLTFAIPGNTAGAGTNIPIPACGIAFGTGIAFALTTEATDAGSTGVAANEIVINMAYA